jgi:3-deoxy-D-manno-octulosonic-acid transferase
LQNNYTQYQILVTTSTPTGSQQLLKLFPDSVTHVYAPYDLPLAVNRFLDRAHPALALIMETEIWPNLYSQCHQRGIPLMLVNARLSARSAASYRRVLPLTQRVLACIDRVAVQNSADAERFLQLGMDRSKLEVMGSIKFDLVIPASLTEQAQALRRLLGVDRSVWIAASTHEGEDEMVLEAFQQLSRSITDALLILVPRHPDRFERVASLCNKYKLNTVRRSKSETCQPDTQVYLGDTMGELLLLYAASDVAFIGGSLVDTGGHNPLEPAALGIVAVVGPYMFNFQDITQGLLAQKGITQVADASQLASQVELLLRSSELRQQMGENAASFVEKNKGALTRLEQMIRDILKVAD